MLKWLVDLYTAESISKLLDGGLTVDSEQQKLFAEGSINAVGSNIISVAGDVAEISITGLLTNAPSFLAFLLGGGNTTYPEIIEAITSADGDDSISRIVLAVDSPGGGFNGLVHVLEAIRATDKPVTARVITQATSAAYAIVAQADDIIVDNVGAILGSIGVVQTFNIDDTTIDITSSAAPSKRHDVTTEEGKAGAIRELDDIHAIFADKVAEGRSSATGMVFTVDRVNKEFGLGALILAEEALDRGMIDSISSNARMSNEGGVESDIETNNNQTEEQREGFIMTLAELMAAHPTLCADLKAQGAKDERVRVTAHLTSGEASGDMKTALAAVESGDEYNMAYMAKYNAASMNRNDVNDSIEEDADADAVLAAAEGGEPALEAEAQCHTEFCNGIATGGTV